MVKKFSFILNAPQISDSNITHNSDKLKSKTDLINSYKFSLQNVQILCYETFYRLLVIHKNVLLTDRYFRTLKAAKIAFLRLHEHRAKHWKNKPKSEWSRFLDFANISKKYIDLRSVYLRMARL